MDLYLMQHGLAVSAEEDPDRALTLSGRLAVEQVSRRAAACGVRIGRCIHSGKTRAGQTAHALAEAVDGWAESRDGLNPSDPVQPIATWLRQEAEADPSGAIALVGHLPFLDRLAGVLVVGDQDAHPVRFHNAGLVKLVPDEDGQRYSVEWILTPDLAV